MRIQSIGQYYSPNYNNNVSKSVVKQNSITFGAYDANKDNNERYLTAYFLSEAKRIFDERKADLIESKHQELSKVYTNADSYDLLKNMEGNLRGQEDLVKSLQEKYERYNPSGSNFEEDVEKGHQIIEKFIKTRNIKKLGDFPDFNSDRYGYNLNDITDTPVGDFPFYNPS